MSRAATLRRVIRNRLRQARELAGLSQGQVARILNVHRPTISEIEAGNRRVSAEEIARFAEVYEVGIEWLFGQGPEKRVNRRDRSVALQNDAPTEWTEEKNARRCELIDRKIQNTITADEAEELETLQQAIERHLDRVAPLPLDGARRLHAELLRKRRTK